MELFLRVGLANALAAGVLALGAATVGVFAQRRPALRHGLWLLVLLKLVTPPLWTVPVAWIVAPVEAGDGNRDESARIAAPTVASLSVEGFEGSSALVDESGIAAEAPVARIDVMVGPPARGVPWWGWVLAAWGGGSLLTAGVAVWRIRRFQALLTLAEPGPEALRVQVEALAGRLGLRHPPEAWLVPGPVSPMLWALGCRPRLIVPGLLWDRLDARQRATLLVHELAHLKRRDHWVRVLELLVTGLYWWFPLVWIARRALREAEEQCCDAWVVWVLPDAARTYAGALLEAVDFLSGVEPAVPLAASGLGQVGHLKRRLTMIMQGTTPRTLTWSGLLAVLGLSVTLLPLSPSWAQRPESAETPAASEKPEARDPGPRAESKAERSEDERDKPADVAAPKPKKTAIFKKKKAPVFTYPKRSDGENLAATPAFAPEKPESRDPGPRPERERPDATPARAEDRVIRERVERSETSSRERDPERPRAEQPGRGETRSPRDEPARRREAAPATPSRRGSLEVVKDDREASERRAEVQRLKAEVESRREALMDAEKRLLQAVRQLDEREGVGRNVVNTRRFEYRINTPGHEGVIEIVPRPDQDKRMAELEERLERLQDEVKTLKKAAPAKP